MKKSIKKAIEDLSFNYKMDKLKEVDPAILDQIYEVEDANRAYYHHIVYPRLSKESLNKNIY